MSAGPWALTGTKWKDKDLVKRESSSEVLQTTHIQAFAELSWIPRLSSSIHRALCKSPGTVTGSQPNSAYFGMALIHGNHKGDAARVPDKLRPDQRSPGEWEDGILRAL